jgi:hypothetical protein
MKMWLLLPGGQPITVAMHDAIKEVAWIPQMNLLISSYYIKHLRIGGFIFCHGNFLLYPFYPSIRRIIFIFG